jgi:hypothetical protein
MITKTEFDHRPVDTDDLAWAEADHQKTRIRANASFLLSRLNLVTALFAVLFLSSCTAGSRSAVLARFPADIVVGEFKFFETDWRSCTFAEVSINNDLKIDPTLISASLRALDAVDLAEPFSVLEFPDSGFHYFTDLSVAEMASRLRHQGDEDLAYEVEEAIFSAKRCWTRDRTLNSQEQARYTDLILDRDGVIVLGAEIPNTVILLYPDSSRAFYFGP